MIIAVAGPYSASTEAERQLNYLKLNQAAAQLLELGHVPIVGVNAALPVIEQSARPDAYEAILQISIAAISACDALLLLAESPGANREKKYLEEKGRPIFYSIEEIKNAGKK